MPHFFAHVARQKGYYNPKKKNYIKYHTTMDYVQTVVNGFRIKNKYKEDDLDFYEILDNKLYYTTHINQKQINKIYSIIKKYINEKRKAYTSDVDMYEKKIINEKLYGDLIFDICNENIGFSTLYELLRTIEIKDNSNIKNILFQILFTTNSKSFNKAILTSSTMIDELRYCNINEDCDLKLYNIGLKITKKCINSQID